MTLAAVSAATLPAGCITAAAGAAAGVGLFAVQDRTIGEGIDDAAASQEVKTRLMAADRVGFLDVDVEVANGNLLLSGSAPSERHRQAAEMIARNVRSVDHVYNEIMIGPRSSFTRGARDEWITAQIRTRLAASRSVRAININIETFQGNVYLMGLARSQDEVVRAAEIASVTPGVERVVSFMQVRTPDAYGAADIAATLKGSPAEPAPAEGSVADLASSQTSPAGY